MQAQILIADISGYTRFMTLHRTSMAHAQVQITRLLESVIRAAKPRRWKLSKLEGDAAFLYRPTLQAGLSQDVAAIREQFLRRRAHLVADNLCNCGGCSEVGSLSVKFIAHEGEVVKQRVFGSEELAGLDVILAHRLLKNSVPIKDYLLVTEAALAKVGDPHQAQANSTTESLEGIGDTKAFWLDLDRIAPLRLEVKPASGLVRVLATMGTMIRSLPVLSGLIKPCDRVADAARLGTVRVAA